MRKTLFNSWFSLAVFVVLIILVPYKVSFFTFKPSDFWLIAALFYQYSSGNNRKIQFKGRKLLVSFGIVLGVTAVIATFLQAYSDVNPLKLSFFSHFFRFFRFYLIYKFVENIILSNTASFSRKFLNAYTWIGGVVFLLSFLEYLGVQPFSNIILGLYYVADDERLLLYLQEIQRLSGVMGNANATAITVLSFLIYPSVNLILRKSSVKVNIINILYVLTGTYIILIMTSSRTSILMTLLMFLFLIFMSIRNKKSIIRLASVTLLFLITIFILINTLDLSFELSDRVTYLIEGRNTRGEKSNISEIMGREELWQDRIDGFIQHGHSLSVFTGMGYTKVYKDYADNGLLSSFLNLGLIGLISRIMLYYLVISFVFKYSIKMFSKSEHYWAALTFSLIALLLLAWEITSDSVEHIKIGQLLFMFISISGVVIAKSRLSLK
jgi:hypothetical protein